jgi:hypothetical protein
MTIYKRPTSSPPFPPAGKAPEGKGRELRFGVTLKEERGRGK